MRPHLAAFAVALITSTAATQQWQWTIDRALPGELQGQIAYDEARERMVLFGAVDLGSGPGTQRSYTCEWDGTRWLQRAVEGGPVLNARVYSDPLRGRVVRTCGLYGGQPTGIIREWDGYTWTPRPSGPSSRSSHGCTFHTATGQVLLFGGRPYGNNVFFGDTWLLTGNSWSQPTLAVTPSPRYGHAMTYDAARQRSVLFGGAGAGNVFNSLRSDTWEWDGSVWLQRQRTSAPTPRVEPGLAYDPLRARAVLFGGFGQNGSLDDTWEWDGIDWHQVATAIAPSPRGAAALAFDPPAGRVMLFGGRTDYVRFTDTWSYDGMTWQRLRGDSGPSRRVGPAVVHDRTRGLNVLFGGWPEDGMTWESDGVAWIGVRPNPSPVGRYDHHAAFDWWRGKTVMFGGREPGMWLGDTWEWDGVAWTQHITTPSPTPRSGGCMAFDGGRGVCVLFAGQNQQGVFSETWEWDGAGWTQRATATTPQYTSFAMTYDEVIGRIVMFGGSDYQGARADTWHYDGVDWTLMGTAGPSAPTPRYDPALTFHAGRGRTVLFGGGQWPTWHDDLWEWDGSAWTQWNVPPGPEPQTGATIAFDRSNDRLVLTGGYSGQSIVDSWVLSPAGPAVAANYGSGCAVSTLPTLRSDLPFLGNVGHTLEIGSAQPASPVLLLCGLGTDNAALPGGCTLLVQSPFVTALLTTNAYGTARHRVPVSRSPALRGATVQFQALVCDLVGPLGGTSWTAGLRLVVGD